MKELFMAHTWGRKRKIMGKRREEEGGECKENERGITLGVERMRETGEADVVSNGAMKGGQKGNGRGCVALRQMYWLAGWSMGCGQSTEWSISSDLTLDGWGMRERCVHEQDFLCLCGHNIVHYHCCKAISAFPLSSGLMRVKTRF